MLVEGAGEINMKPRNINEATYQQLTDQLVNNGIVRICHTALLAIELKRPHLTTGKLIKDAREENKEAEMWIEGFIKRIPQDMSF